MSADRDEPYFPDVPVVLTGHSTNAGAIMDTVVRALRAGGASLKDVDLFREECMSGDYNYLLQTCFAWVRVL